METNPALRAQDFVSRKLEGLNHIKQSLNLGTCTTTANAWPTTSHWYTQQKQMKNAIAFSKCVQIHLLFTQQDYSFTLLLQNRVKWQENYLKQRERSRNLKEKCSSSQSKQGQIKTVLNREEKKEQQQNTSCMRNTIV